ncbi:SURF1 family cytochrome oxidase biogenesis protein [Planomonospora sp. ID82291]|uniref:SURF1 family cytochrome oxidase biogenesis protein n=1 Tax=Planomonospora sp. ID82291 TaxID=2738136 RepID=UPI0018C43A9B|nr:SURF1 family cytochrome oxidase biogenesis protein [Planomonospora sp. ID82291]MBG0813204.1 SURF1 family protein [Planomonospora sp. ID82291]
MLRILFSPRVVVLHLLAVGALVVCGLLGRWQLGVFEDSGRPQSTRDPAPVAVGTLTAAGRHLSADAIGRRVTAEGAYDASRQLLVAQRDEGLWILTPLDLGDGTAIPVVRGWVPAAGDPAAAVPQGKVTVTGRLQGSEPTDSVQRRTRQLPRGQVLTVSSAELVNLWRGVRLRDGFVIATAQSPAPPAAVRPVHAPAPTQEGVLTWRNLAYAAQWWIFGLFAVFMWWHFVRDALRGGRAAPEPGTGAEPGTGPDPGAEPDPGREPAAGAGSGAEPESRPAAV